MKIESVMTKLILEAPYPDRDSYYIVYSRYNCNDLFWRARDTIIKANVNFDISIKERRIWSNKLKVFFIDDIEYSIHSVELEGFMYDEDEFINSRTFMSYVRPQLVYRYGATLKVE